jgi:hypothetical protein
MQAAERRTEVADRHAIILIRVRRGVSVGGGRSRPTGTEELNLAVLRCRSAQRSCGPREAPGDSPTPNLYLSMPAAVSDAGVTTAAASTNESARRNPYCPAAGRTRSAFSSLTRPGAAAGRLTEMWASGAYTRARDLWGRLISG